MTEEQIHRYIPKTAVEQETIDDLKKMKDDIAYLLKEVEDLKAGRSSPEQKGHGTKRGESLISIDKMHEEKRRMKEEQLLRDHPNFKPSKRLKDSLTEVQGEPKIV